MIKLYYVYSTGPVQIFIWHFRGVCGLWNFMVSCKRAFTEAETEIHEECHHQDEWISEGISGTILINYEVLWLHHLSYQLRNAHAASSLHILVWMIERQDTLPPTHTHTHTTIYTACFTILKFWIFSHTQVYQFCMKFAVQDVTLHRSGIGSRRFERYVPWSARCKQSSNFPFVLYEHVPSKRWKPVTQRYSHTQEHLNSQLHLCENLTSRIVSVYSQRLVFLMEMA